MKKNKTENNFNNKQERVKVYIRIRPFNEGEMKLGGLSPFKSLDIKNYDNLLKEMYYLLTDLYKDFPIYKHICQQDFIDVFHNYKLVLNPTMVKLAYYKNKLVGFFISIPNYSDKVHKLNIINILK